MPIKTFRGLMADLTTDTIVLHTNDGSTGYKIKKFQIISKTPGADTVEAVVKIYKTPQTGTPDGEVDFSDQTLLAVADYHKDANPSYPVSSSIIFDGEIFNQDIYVTCFDNLVGVSMNYYIELEQVKLDLNENTVATLKDIRNLS
jgi:hypothetical protein